MGKCAQYKPVFRESSSSPSSSSPAKASAETFASPDRVVVGFESKNKKDLVCSLKVMIDAVVWKRDAAGNVMTAYCPVAKKQRPLAAGYGGTGLTPQYMKWIAHARMCQEAIDNGRRVLEESAASGSAKKRPRKRSSSSASKKAKKEEQTLIDLSQDSD